MEDERMLETPKVRDILNEKVIALTPNFTVLEAIQALNKYRISTAPVVSSQNEVIGYISESDSIELQDINLALLRIDNGEYGICVSCGDEISHERIKAIPFADKCIVCEKGEV